MNCMEFTLNPCILPFRRRIWWKYSEKIMWKWCTSPPPVVFSFNKKKLDPDPNFKTRIRNTYRQTVSRNLNHKKLKVIRIPWLRILQKNMQIRILLIKKEASNPNTMFSHGWYSDPHFSRYGSATMSTYRKTLKKNADMEF